MLVLAIGLLFVLLFGHALTSYVRRRDPLAGEVALLFGGVSGLFALSSLRSMVDDPPSALVVTSIAVLLAKPVLTLRLVSRLQALPSWLLPVAVVLYVVSAAPVALAQGEASAWVTWLAVGSFAVTECVAAAYFVVQGGRHTGASRWRLYIAASSTGLFAAALLAAGSGESMTARLMALLSALGYLAAFMPPRRIRRMWAMAAAHQHGRDLLSAPADSTPAEIWRRYASAVHETAETDAVVVLARTASGGTSALATVGLDPESRLITEPVDFAAFDRLTRQRRIDTRRRVNHALATPPTARYATVVPLPAPDGGTTQHVAVLLSRYRSLFSNDDLDVIRDLGLQAALLAGRAAAAAEQRRLASELAVTVDALRVASKAKSDLITRVSHEFRTPLTAIIGYSALMRRTAAPDAPSLASTSAERIHKAGQHLLGLVEHVLDLSAMDAAHLPLRTEDVDVAALVAACVDDLRPLAERKRLTVHSDVASAFVSADRDRLRQVLESLLSNAIKFTPEGGRIAVRTEVADDEVRIRVVDTGIGIAASDQARVFDDFIQVGDEAHNEGTGLGLSIARRLVDAHGGRIQLESAPGEGSRFTVRLPRDRMVARPPSSAAS
ncbi:MAG: HAMP domain-containing histidine kinase [Actinomycetota bacterium]|nr:HAMP domain-containing histidine kinase [Actinomycetota bacterium]